jgi:hypothetical protein
MRLKRLALLLAAVCVCQPSAAQLLDRPEGFQLVIGPRVGAGWMMETPQEFTEELRAMYPTGNYYPVLTMFGITLEQRILLGETRSHFAFQEIVLVAGLEQGLALPEAAVLIGYRDYSGLEFGIGPIMHLNGFGVVIALGWTFAFKGVYVPFDVSYTIPSGERAGVLSFTTGFNFQRRRY